MSLHDYRHGIELHREGEPFYGLIMAAMLGADTDNLAKLRAAWPELHAELQERYDAPQGLLAGEHNPVTGDTREGLDEIRRRAGLS